MTVRTPCAAVGHGAHYHSQQNEAFFSHAPGLVLVCPRSCVQAKGLLLSSLANKNPVIFFEPKSLYRKLEEEVPEKYYELDLFKAEVVREGQHLTMISYGAQFHIMRQAADEYMHKHKDISIELIDLQTVYPIDIETIEKSVKKTGRCIVTHEAPLGSGLGAEIVAQI